MNKAVQTIPQVSIILDPHLQEPLHHGNSQKAKTRILLCKPCGGHGGQSSQQCNTLSASIKQRPLIEEKTRRQDRELGFAFFRMTSWFFRIYVGFMLLSLRPSEPILPKPRTHDKTRGIRPHEPRPQRLEVPGMGLSVAIARASRRKQEGPSSHGP